MNQFQDVFSTEPGLIYLVHEIKSLPGVIVHQCTYRVPEACSHAIETEVTKMLHDGIIGESTSPWSIMDETNLDFRVPTTSATQLQSLLPGAH